MNEATDELLERFRQGDRSAYETLCARYEPSLRCFLRQHASAGLISAHPEDDLLHEVHLEALGSLGRFKYRRRLSFYFWLCGIARNLLARHYRRLGQAPPVWRPPSKDTGASSAELLTSIAASDPSPLETLARQEELAALAAALETLPARRREALILRYVEGHDVETASRLSGSTPGAFRVLVSRALVDLR